MDVYVNVFETLARDYRFLQPLYTPELLRAPVNVIRADFSGPKSTRYTGGARSDRQQHSVPTVENHVIVEESLPQI